MRMIFAASLLALTGASADAIELAQTGSSATLRGAINAGDHNVFRDFLARPSSKQIRVLYLHSPGGQISTAGEIARAIRAANLTTAVDASRAVCDSACTIIFAGGVRRHYVNAQSIADGGPRSRKLGLGFHEGSGARGSLQGGRIYSPHASAQVINLYYELGVGGAASLVTKASFEQIHRISGATALSLGVATSLSPP